MPQPATRPGPEPAGPARFHTTVWSRVLRAGRADDPSARPALAELCRAYWPPLYAYARRRGAPAAEAEDAGQGFFAWLLESNALRYADPGRGRFRGFLAAAFRQYLTRKHEYDTAAKRCPPAPLLPLYGVAHEPADHLTPDAAFEYAWAVAVLGRAMDRLQAEQEAAGRGERFAAFQGMMTGQSAEPTAVVAARVGMTEGAVRVAVHRLRQRFAALLREEVSVTLDDGDDPADELRHLLQAVRAGGRV
ncbi:MAG: sigma-70 family RNA polymerase sigma factor [Gemmataceae bacterium]